MMIVAWVAAAPASAAAAPTRIVALGDSLTAGFGVAPEDAFPVRLQAWLKAHGVDAEVVNAGVSGDTTRGRSRASRLGDGGAGGRGAGGARRQ